MSTQYLSVNTHRTCACQPVTITVNVTNSGTETGNYTVNLRINGQVEQTTTVSVVPHSAYPVKFTCIKCQPGTYDVTVDGQRTSFIIDDCTRTNTTSSPGSGGLIAIFAGAVLIVITAVVLLLIFRRRTS